MIPAESVVHVLVLPRTHSAHPSHFLCERTPLFNTVWPLGPDGGKHNSVLVRNLFYVVKDFIFLSNLYTPTGSLNLTLRLRVTCASDWASRVPQKPLNCNLCPESRQSCSDPPTKDWAQVLVQSTVIPSCQGFVGKDLVLTSGLGREWWQIELFWFLWK